MLLGDKILMNTCDVTSTKWPAFSNVAGVTFIGSTKANSGAPATRKAVATSAEQKVPSSGVGADSFGKTECMALRTEYC